jgi:cyclic pyranopterin monophosphate synthase
VARQRRTHEKPVVYRRAVARGELKLRPSTVTAIRRRSVTKGDPVAAGEIAGLLAMKRTSELIPHCHAIALTGSRVEFTLRRDRVVVTAEAETLGRTGVEMEALTGAAVALLALWDMVKYLEKDARGLYPATRLGALRVVTKEKGEP